MIPLADATAGFLKQKQQQAIFEIPPGFHVHYDLKTIDRCYRRWEMMDKPGKFPDIRDVVLEDEDYENDMWWYHTAVLWRMGGKDEQKPADMGDDD